MKKQAFNPMLPLDTYIPDVEPHVFGGRVYLYGSHDVAGGEFFCPLDYECWSAPVTDLTDWRCEGIIYRAEQCPHYCEERQDLYAPDVAQGPDSRYYLYYDLSGRKGSHGFDGPISVAVCDTPAGRYEYYGDVKYPDGRPLSRFIPFDPAVINDNGHIYLTYGWGLGMDTHSWMNRLAIPAVMSKIFNKSIEEIKREEPSSILGANLVELEDDMLTVKEEPKRIFPAMNNTPKDSPLRDHTFYEGCSLRKFGEWYYFIYSSHLNHELCYAVSRYPDHGFEYKGVIISNGDVRIKGRKEKDRLYPTGTNHGSIEMINGKYYIFYHRMTHNSAYSRQVCAEEIQILPDGTIPQVKMTSCGLNGGPLEGRGIYPAAICCNLTDGRMPHTANGKCRKKKPCIIENGGQQYITNVHDHTLIGYKYFYFYGETEITLQVRGTGKGVFSVCTSPAETGAEISVEPSDEWKKSTGRIKIKGTHILYLIYKGSGSVELLDIQMRDL